MTNGEKNGKEKGAAVQERPEPRQMQFEITPDTALGRYSQQYVEQKDRIAREKDKLEPICNDIVNVMRKEKRVKFTVTHLGERYVFEIKDGKAALKCSRKVEASGR